MSIQEQRIDAVLKQISELEIIELPAAQSFKVNDFVDTVAKQAQKGGESLEKMSQRIEDDVHDLVRVFASHEPERKGMSFSCH